MAIQNKSVRIISVGFILGLLIAGGVYLLFLRDRETSVIEYNVFPVIGENEDNTIYSCRTIQYVRPGRNAV